MGTRTPEQNSSLLLRSTLKRSKQAQARRREPYVAKETSVGRGKCIPVYLRWCSDSPRASASNYLITQILAQFTFRSPHDSPSVH
jgi:hypothetical protein